MQQNIVVIVDRLILSNWRKIPFLDLLLDEKENWIIGTNEVGKSTVASAHCWLWSQYDINNLESYEIKPRNVDGKNPEKNVSGVEEHIRVINKTEGTEYSLAIRRELVDIWDEENNRITGNEQLFYLDGVKQKTKRAFMEALDAIVGTELFRIMTSPTFFLTMKNEDMRKHILNLVGGDISDADLMRIKPEKYDKLIGILQKKKIEDYFKDVKQALSAAESQCDKTIPASRNEVNLAISKLPTRAQFEEIHKTLEARKKELEALEVQLAGLGEDPAIAAIAKLKSDLASEESAQRLFVTQFNNKLAEENGKIEATRIPLRNTITTSNSEIATLQREISSKQTEIASIGTTLKNLTEKWHTIDKEVFVEPVAGANCSECGKPYTAEEIAATRDTAETNFKQGKADRKSAVRSEGDVLSEKKTTLEGEVTAKQKRITDLETTVSEAQTKLDSIKSKEAKAEDDPDYKAIGVRIDELKTKIAAPVEISEEGDNTELLNKKETLTSAIATLNQEYGQLAVLESNEQRLAQLAADLDKINEEALKWKKAKSVIMEYLVDKSTILEEKVNQMFETIKFQLFEFNQSAQPDDMPRLVCIPKIGGAYYPVANRGAQILAHVDVARTFGKKYGITLPIFVDNKESAVKPFPEMDAQVIYLKVDENVPTLTLRK